MESKPLKKLYYVLTTVSFILFLLITLDLKFGLFRDSLMQPASGGIDKVILPIEFLQIITLTLVPAMLVGFVIKIIIIRKIFKNMRLKPRFLIFSAVGIYELTAPIMAYYLIPFAPSEDGINPFLWSHLGALSSFLMFLFFAIVFRRNTEAN